MRIRPFKLVLIVLSATGAYSQGIITTAAGVGSLFRGAGGPAIKAALGEVHGLAIDPSGNVYVTDVDNNLVLKITKSGTIAVLAGNGISGYSGDGGLATKASLNGPYRVAVDRASNVYVADLSNIRVRRIGSDGII